MSKIIQRKNRDGSHKKKADKTKKESCQNKE
jgi:hypothetical protein